MEHIVDFLSIVGRGVEVAGVHNCSKAKSVLILDFLGIHIRFGPDYGDGVAFLRGESLHTDLDDIESRTRRRAEHEYGGVTLEKSRRRSRLDDVGIYRPGVEGESCSISSSLRSVFHTHRSTQKILYLKSMPLLYDWECLTCWMSLVFPTPLSPTTATLNLFLCASM